MSEHNLPATIGISADEFLKAAQENESFGRQDQIIPFTRILQPLSPQVQEGNTAYTPGAKPGMFHNAATNSLLDGTKGLHVIHIAHRYNYVEWIPRNEGGGFVKDWREDEKGWQDLCEPAERIAYQPKTRDGHVISRARHFYIYQVDLETGEVETAILPFATTSLRVAKAWSSMMGNAPKVRVNGSAVVPPYHYYIYHVTAERVTNAKGTWYLPKIKHHIIDNKYQTIFDAPNGQLIWQMATEFKEALREGNIQAASEGNFDTENSNGVTLNNDTF